MDVPDGYVGVCPPASARSCPNTDNRVTLATETDDDGAVAATRLLFDDGKHHVLGTCRMATDPATSVVDRDCRSHDVGTSWICDGSILPAR